MTTMWELRNRTPYAAERTWTVDKDGRSHWVVAVRGTFDIAPDGSPKLAEEQLPPEAAPVWSGEPGLSSLRYDADLVALKPGTDVVVNGTAHAPRGRPATKCKVAFVLGDRTKNLEITGDLQLHGTTRPITVLAKKVGEGPDPWGGYRIGYDVEFTVKRSDYGMKYMLPSDDGPGIGDEVHLMISLEAKRQ